MKPFIEFFIQLRQAVVSLTQLHLSWKDADPTLWSKFPAEISQHRHPSCLWIKSDFQRNATCCRADNQLLGEDLHQTLDFENLSENVPTTLGHHRTCPFGLQEWRIPIFWGDRYLGCCYLGVWGRSQLEGKNLPKPSDQSLAGLIHLLKPWTRDLAKKRIALDAQPQTLNDPLVSQAIDYMETHLNASLNLNQVAQAVHLSASRLRHRMVETLGQNFTQLLQQKLMNEAAARLIQYPHARILDIALTLGWNDQRYFSTAFKRYFGSSPEQWRKSTLQFSP